MRYSRVPRTWSITIGAGIIAAALATVWLTMPERRAGPCVVVSGPSALPEIAESSGLAVGRRTPGVLWSHNDSGNDAVLFALDTGGRLLGRVRVPVRTRDWEDVSAGPCPAGDCLYVADIGDNRGVRAGIRVFRVAEPAPADSVTTAPEEFDATYADGPHNAEAMFVADATAFIVTRDRTGGVYRAEMTSPGKHLVFRKINELGLAAVTDAETSRDGRTVVVRTSHEAVFYRTGELSRGTVQPYARIRIDGLREPQGEGVALDGDLLYLSSEGRAWNRGGWLIGLRCELSR
jgi:hypothetical protein